MPSGPKLKESTQDSSALWASPFVVSIRFDHTNGVFRQVTQINIVVFVDADAVADGFGAVAFHLLTERFRVKSFIGQISRLNAIKTRSMHGTKIHPLVLQILGDGVDADARPDQMADGIFHLNGSSVDNEIDLLGNNAGMICYMAALPGHL